MGCNEEIIDAALGQDALRALQHLDLESLDIGMQYVETPDLPVPEKGVNLEFAIADEGLDELAPQPVAREIILTGLQAGGVRLDQDDLCFGPRLLEPHGIMAPIGA